MIFVPDSSETFVGMSSWSIREVEFETVEGSSRHAVGIVDFGYGRVCSPIQSFNQEKMEIVTRSGKTYRLVGEPGFSNDAEYVWGQWCAINKVTASKDVTKEYLKNDSE